MHQYIEQGGTLVSQYNKLANLPAGGIGPYPFIISRDRITDERAAVTLRPDYRHLYLDYCCYRLLEDDRFQYRMVIRTGRIDNVARLTELWRQHPDVREFCISPTGD